MLDSRRSSAAGPIVRFLVLLAAAIPCSAAEPPTFYRDILPILQDHCQLCHRQGEMAPFPLVTYRDARARADAIRDAVQAKKMPPWFADPRYGQFANDASLSEVQIRTLAAWAGSGAPAGDPREAPPERHWTPGWNIPAPDALVKMPVPVTIPARGDVEYTYEIVPTGFAEDRWVQSSEIRPSSRDHVHHAVLYIRPPDSTWLRRAPVGVPFTASSLKTEEDRNQAHWTTSDMLLVYAPGSSPDQWPQGMAKFVPRGSDLVFQMHYTTNGRAAQDQASVGMIFSKAPPQQRVLTLQLTNDHFAIPPGADDYRVEAHGTLPNDAVLLSFFPHMHVRGKRFEYNISHPGGGPDGGIEPLLAVHYDFHWQLSYKLAKPRELKAGTVLQAVGYFDNSRKNPHNPDPNATVRWGDQTFEEMMVGFFDLAVPASVDKWQFFIREENSELQGAEHRAVVNAARTQ